MKRFYGFDLGDAESAVSLLEKNSELPPTILEIEGVRSFITAYAALSDGTLLIGENACYAKEARKRKLRFKSRFLKDPAVRISAAFRPACSAHCIPAEIFSATMTVPVSTSAVRPAGTAMTANATAVFLNASVIRR